MVGFFYIHVNCYFCVNTKSMATSAQIESVISISKSFNLVTGQLTVTDNSNYAGSLTLASPYRIYGLFQIIDPNGTVVYVNSGYATDNFSSPDTDIANSDFTHVVNIPTATGGGFIFGVYQINYTVKVVEDFGTTNLPTNIVVKPDTGNLCKPYPDKCTNNFEYNCNTAIIKNTDTTAYGAYSTLTRVHQLIPPPLSNQPTQTGSQTTLIYNSGTPYTGTWSWKITSTLVYVVGNNTNITVQILGEGEQDVVCDTNFCKLLCVLLSYRKKFLQRLGKQNIPQQDWNDYDMAWNEFTAAYHAQLCGKSNEQIQTYINKIYDIIGIDDACDCGCNGETPTPILPTTIINGQDGQDGQDGISPILRYDSGYLQVSYNNGGIWTNLIDLSLLVGQNGTTVLINEPAESSATYLTNSTIAAELIVNKTIPANTFQANGDVVEIEYTCYITGESANVKINFAGTTIITPSPFSNQLELEERSGDCFDGRILISKYNSNSVEVIHKAWGRNILASNVALGGDSYVVAQPIVVTGIDFTASISVQLESTSPTINCFYLSHFLVTSKKIQ